MLAVSASEVFASHVPSSHRDTALAIVDLGERLGSLFRAGEKTWPGVRVAESVFARHLASHVPEDATIEEVLTNVHAADLYLALGCVEDPERALAAFDRTFLREATSVVERMNVGGVAATEVEQLLREKLFVGAGESPPKIMQYSGSGPLGGWLRVVAVRAALAVRRTRAAETSAHVDDVAALADVAGSDDPELEHLRRTYAEPFEAALRDTLRVLPEKDRALLRMHLADGLTVDQLGLLLGVHRATAARWLASAREQVLTGTRDLLLQRLELSESEFRSIVGLLISRLDLSIQRVLAVGAD